MASADLATPSPVSVTIRNDFSSVSSSVKDVHDHSANEVDDMNRNMDIRVFFMFAFLRIRTCWLPVRGWIHSGFCPQKGLLPIRDGGLCFLHERIHRLSWNSVSLLNSRWWTWSGGLRCLKGVSHPLWYPFLPVWLGFPVFLLLISIQDHVEPLSGDWEDEGVCLGVWIDRDCLIFNEIILIGFHLTVKIRRFVEKSYHIGYPFWLHCITERACVKAFPGRKTAWCSVFWGMVLVYLDFFLLEMEHISVVEIQETPW